VNTQNKNFDLTQGPILQKLVKMSMPLMATSFMQMAFNLSDMFWLGIIGDEAVAAAGTAGLFLWLSMAFIFIGRMGAQIGVSQNMGRGDEKSAQKYAQNAFVISLILGTIYASIVVIFNSQLIGFFAIEDASVVYQARTYLWITALALPLMFAHHVITGIFIGLGNTKIPFIINSLTLAINIAITPFFIFVMDMGIGGAAVGTIVATVINLALKLWVMLKYKNRPFKSYKPFAKLESAITRQIFRWGVPIGIESALFTLLFMLVARLVADFGTDAIAAQRVGSQVESLAWMMAGGFAAAVTSFIGQNYGAKKFKRVRQVYKLSLITMGLYGLFVSIVLFVFARPFISIFLQEEQAIIYGVEYLQVFALIQTLYCMEEMTAGAFRGRGLTTKPTIVSVSCNILRVVFAYGFVHFTDIGLIGVWIGIVISVAIRGVWMLVWYKINTAKTLPKHDEIITG